MHNYPKNNPFLCYNSKLYRMIDMHSKYDSMYKNELFYVLICINNHLITCNNCMLLDIKLSRKNKNVFPSEKNYRNF